MILKKSFTALIFLVIVLLLSSCSGSGPAKLEISDTNSFPVLELKNACGPDIVIQPVSDDRGSIGFKQEGKVHWIQGEPVEKLISRDQAEYVWDIDNRFKARVQVKRNNDDLEMKMNLLSDDNSVSGEEWFFNIKASDEEYFTGAIERVVDGPQGNSWSEDIKTAMNLRNEIVVMKIQPTVSAYAPFYLSSGNYGLFVLGTWPGLFDFCKSKPNTVQVSFEGPEVNFKFYIASTPDEIVKKHALETGPSYLAPRWAFGPWRWRDEHRNNETYFDGSEVKSPYNSEIAEDILMMQAYDIPCTAYWIDRPWGTGPFGYDDFEIDYDRLPQFEKMISWLSGKDIALMLWICPWAYGDMADAAIEKGYNLTGREMRPPQRPAGMQAQRPAGIPAAPQGGMRGDRNMLQRVEQRMAVMDFTNPEAVKWWGENGPAKLAKMGVKGFKLDRGDGERLVDSLNLKTFSGISYRENYNDYCRQFIKATYDAVKPVLGDDFLLFPRAQYTGSARYGGMWAGDTYSSDKGLRSVLIGLQRCAIMGYPVWGSDVCGYSGPLDREVSMRWIGFACFSPIMEIGPTNNKGFWDLNSEPSYDHELIAVWRFYSNLRMSLVDYIYDLAKNASETGMPIARPLFLEYPDQAECWNNWETYKFGDDLLVSVIWEKGATKTSIYLPSGETWIDLWNGREYEGGQYIDVDAPLYQTPVFLRKGSSLSLPDFNDLYAESVNAASVVYNMTDLETKEVW